MSEQLNKTGFVNCPSCGLKLNEKAKFCYGCGARTTNATTSSKAIKAEYNRNVTQKPQPSYTKNDNSPVKPKINHQNDTHTKNEPQKKSAQSKTTKIKVKSFLIGSIIALLLVLLIGASFLLIKASTKKQSPITVAANTVRDVGGDTATDFIAEAELIKYETENDAYKKEFEESGTSLEINEEQKHLLEELEKTYTANSKYEQFQYEKEVCPPKNINPLIKNPELKNYYGIPEEGNWVSVEEIRATDGNHLFYRTVVRPDEKQPWSRVELVLIRKKYLNLGVVGGSNVRANTRIPKDERPYLVATFNGGFQQVHDRGGVIVDGKTYVNLIKNKGSVFVFDNGDIEICEYTDEVKDRFENDLKNIMFARQNQPILINNGLINKRVGRWGWVWTGEKASAGAKRSASAGYGWRSALGMRKDGNLIYAVGNFVTARSLARALVMAECEFAMHLDMNPAHVIFNVFSLVDGKPKIIKVAPRQTGDSNWLKRVHLTGYERDYFYLTIKQDNENSEDDISAFPLAEA